MSNFDQEAFNEFVLANNVVGFFRQPVTLNSGRTSHWYVNWRTVVEDVFLLDQLTDYVLAFTRDLGLEPDCFYGVPEGATKLGVLTQYKLARELATFALGSHALPMGRGKPKDHGDPKDRFFLGQPRGKTVILEDVTTTGSSLLTSVDNLREVEVQIIAALSLTNRMELRADGLSVQAAVEAKDVPYHTLSSALQLLPILYKRLNPGEDIGKAVEAEFKRYGVDKLKLY